MAAEVAAFAHTVLHVAAYCYSKKKFFRTFHNHRVLNASGVCSHAPHKCVYMHTACHSECIHTTQAHQLPSL